LTRVVESVIRKSETAFILGRNILEGVVILHETLHEVRRKKGKGIILKLDFDKAYDKVQWSFLMEVMEREKIPAKWRRWIQDVLSGGRVGINFNGEPGEFFRTHKGLRQGDPVFPLLFNLVADASATIIKKGRDAGLIRGFIPKLVEGGLTHLQYADDTVIFMKADRQWITNVKFLLYCFEHIWFNFFFTRVRFW
jgi:hypothetical protein